MKCDALVNALRAALLLAAVSLPLRALPAIAAQTPIIVQVTVVGNAAGDVASIFTKALAKDVLVAKTDSHGHATITVPVGTDVFARTLTATSSVGVVQGPSLTLDLRPRIIATVVAHPTLGSTLVNAQSAAAIVSGDVGNSLSYVPNYRSEAEGGSGNSRLNGTSLSLPSLPGSTNFALSSNLISSFSPDQADDGSITPDYHLTTPTGTSQQATLMRAGTDGLASWRSAFTGPGYAFVIADQVQQGRLDGLVFPDASGFSYNHSTNAHELDGSADLEFRVGGAQVSAVAFGTNQRGAAVSFVDPGIVPEGPGPGNRQSTQMLDGYIRATQSRGRDNVVLLHVQYAGGQTNDDLLATSQQFPIPSDSGFRFSGRYDEMSLSRSYGNNVATVKVTDTVDNALAFAQPEQTLTKSSGVGFETNYAHTGAGSSLAMTVTANHETGPFTANHVNASIKGARWTADTRYTWSLYSADSQVIETYYADALRLAVPGSADFSCAGHAAFASGPSAVTPNAPHITATTANVTKRLGARTQITVGGFYTVTRNALVVGAESGASPLSPQYMQTLNAQYAYLCGGAPLRASDVYLTRYVTEPVRIGKEAYVSATTSLGVLSLTAGFEIYSATVFGLPETARSSFSTLINGSQIWNVPLHRGSAIFAYSPRRFTAALGLLYTGGNNAAHLPANLNASVGLKIPIRDAALTLSAQNIFHTYDGSFVSTALSEPSSTTGEPVSFFATPMTTTWSLKYELHTGRGLKTP